MPELDQNQIILKLLDWPFLAVLLLIVIMVKYGDQFRQLLTRGDIQISWGEGKSIQLRELSENLDKDIQPLQDDIDALKQELGKLRSDLAAKSAIPAAARASAAVSFSMDDEETTPEEQVRAALSAPRSPWRSLKRIAALSGCDQQDVIEILQGDSFEVSTDKSGRIVARLKTR